MRKCSSKVIAKNVLFLAIVEKFQFFMKCSIVGTHFEANYMKCPKILPFLTSVCVDQKLKRKTSRFWQFDEKLQFWMKCSLVGTHFEANYMKIPKILPFLTCVCVDQKL